MKIVQYLPVECLDDLVAATGFALGDGNYEYKLTWLLERIGMLKENAESAAILHDNPEKGDLVALIQQERRWSAGLQNTINGLMVDIESLRSKVKEAQ